MFYYCDRLRSSLSNYGAFGLRLSFRLWSFPLALMLLTEIGAIAQAQIVPDNTLPSNSATAPNGDTIEITGGTARGANLFHSFEQFSVTDGQTAFFDNAVTIENIISRVTGGSISDIDGLLQANDANLFLINPNGIVFGENAALDIGGSFVGSTADSLQFADGNEFSAASPESPLLTVNIPTGLQFGNSGGDITVEGIGSNVFFDEETFTINRFERNLGLQVNEGSTLALVGNNIRLDGGNLTAAAGNIELASVAESGTVALTADELGFSLDLGELNGSEISFSNQASIDVSGNGSGNILIQGDMVNLIDGSAIFAETEGDTAGGTTRIEANQIDFSGTDPDEFISSSIWSDVYFDATGDGGNVEIETESLLLQDGGQINVNTFGPGNAGSLNVKADDIRVSGESDFGFFFSALSAQADIFLTGRGGDILIDTNSLLVDDGAEISASTFGDGDAGNLTVIANDVRITGFSEGGVSGLFVSTGEETSGNGGNLTLTTNSLTVSNGAQIQADTSGTGDAGTIAISADLIELTDRLDDDNLSGIFSRTEEGATGNGGDVSLIAKELLIDNAQVASDNFGSGIGGDLTINTPELQVVRGGQIGVSAFGSGNGGTLNIAAENIELDGTSEFASSGLFSSALVGTGDSGDIKINSDRLSITNGATINAGNFPSQNSSFEPGTGQAGSIEIDVKTLKLDSSVAEEPSSITASANTQAGGDIVFNVADEAAIANGSQITAETKGEGTGGNINFNADELSLSDLGQISVNSNGSGDAGNIAIAANSFNLDRGQVTATATQAGGGDINLTTESLFLDENSSISTSVLESDGGGGNIAIDNTDFIVGRNNSSIQADAVEGDGGNIQINTNALFFDASSTITASSQFGLDGVVEIDDIESEKKLSSLQLANNVRPPEAVVASNCPVSKDNTFAITGKGGLSDNPGQYLRGQAVWQDLRIPTTSHSASVSSYSDSAALVEAQAWQVNSSGKVELIAKTGSSDRQGHEERCATSR